MTSQVSGITLWAIPRFRRIDDVKATSGVLLQVKGNITRSFHQVRTNIDLLIEKATAQSASGG